MGYEIGMPAYNAEERVYNTLGRNNGHTSELTVINDGSVDSTSAEVLRFNTDTSSEVGLYELLENKKKIGAIEEFVESLPSSTHYVVLIDDDSCLKPGINQIVNACDRLETRGWASAAFRLRVANPRGILGRLQNLEYFMGNGLRRFLGAKGLQRCVPGAAGIYKKESLEDALESHSGDHDGDDFEITYNLLEKGYKVGYMNDMVVETTVPTNYLDLLEQRRRWERGSIKTNWRKREFVKDNLKGANRLSVVQAVEIGSHALLPYAVYATASGLDNWAIGMIPTILINAGLYASAYKKGEKSSLAMLPLFPIYHLAVTVPSRIAAYYDLVKGKIRSSPVPAPLEITDSSEHF